MSIEVCPNLRTICEASGREERPWFIPDTKHSHSLLTQRAWEAVGHLQFGECFPTQYTPTIALRCKANQRGHIHRNQTWPSGHLGTFFYWEFLDLFSCQGIFLAPFQHCSCFWAFPLALGWIKKKVGCGGEALWWSQNRWARPQQRVKCILCSELLFQILLCLKHSSSCRWMLMSHKKNK